MHRRWTSRALAALVIPAALLTPALSSSAEAAAGPGVPSVAAVATVYPHYAGGTSTESAGKVFALGKNCRQGKPINGARSRSASYAAAVDDTDPSSFLMTGAEPGVFVTAMRFTSAKSAIAYLHSSSRSAKKCGSTAAGGTSVKPEVTRIRFKLGDERWGYRTSVTVAGQTVIDDMLFVRDGRYVVYASAMSTDGVAPSVPQAVQLTKVALIAAR